MHRNSLVLSFLICLSLSASTRAQYACTPGNFPPLSDPVELEIIETQPFPGTAMVPGMQVISAGGTVALMNEPSEESDQCGELDPGVPRQILGIATDEFGEIWYMIRENEIAYHLVWCRGNTLIPDPGHITDVSYLVWLASGLASNGQMTMAHNLIANFAGIGVISEEEGDVLIAVYYPGNPVSECEDMFWHQDCTVLFAGEWGFSFYVICNMASMHEISPSGKYYAIGADGTGTWRGTIDLVDLETGVKYRYDIPRSGVNSYSSWIEGDFLLIQSIGPGPMFENWTGFGNQPWLNYSFRTEAEGAPRDIVLMHGNRAWMILPEDRYYNYRLKDNFGFYDSGIFFDVSASPNVIPSLAGIESYDDFSEWIDSMGGQNEAFPSFDFRVFIDTLNMSVSFLNDSTLSSESGETSSGPLDGMEFVMIPSGSFEMGSPYSEDHRHHDEEQHRVHVDSFELMTTEVTQSMWREVMGISDPERNMTRGEGDDYPMYYISWYDCRDFIDKLNKMDADYTYRLPTEAEWEYACRAGTETMYYWGDEMNDAFCWYRENANPSTQQVGTREPNTWGLYDMSGNVWEWCEDVYTSDYENCPTDGSAYLGSGPARVFRGGSWYVTPPYHRSANRGGFNPDFNLNNYGFRIARSLH